MNDFKMNSIGLRKNIPTPHGSYFRDSLKVKVEAAVFQKPLDEEAVIETSEFNRKAEGLEL